MIQYLDSVISTAIGSLVTFLLTRKWLSKNDKNMESVTKMGDLYIKLSNSMDTKFKEMEDKQKVSDEQMAQIVLNNRSIILENKRLTKHIVSQAEDIKKLTERLNECMDSINN